MNHFQLAIMLAAVLFGGHSALHRWDIRQTRRALMLRACNAPEHVARAWVERQQDDGAPTLWLQFMQGQPHAVAQGETGCADAATRLRVAGLSVDPGAVPKHPSDDCDAMGLPGQSGTSERSDTSPLA